MGAPTATQSSSSTHGGAPTSYSSNVFAGGKLVLRVGDTFSCPTHGSVTVSSGSPTVSNSPSIARDGDSLSCGATLTGGVTSVLIG